MALTEVTYTLRGSTREDVRKEVIELFLLETPGTGTGELCSKYWYTVESISGYSIILKRPVPLNKGFDFTVNVDGLFFKRNRRYTNPSHDDIISACKYVQSENPSRYDVIKTAVSKIYHCQPYERESIAGITFTDYEGAQHPMEIVLLAIKWLFIEQDVTYWNWSGRNMLWDVIKVI